MMLITEEWAEWDTKFNLRLMAEVYSSLYKGLVHVTQAFSASHPALDMGNWKTRNPIYSPTNLGKGKITKITTSYTYNGIYYPNSLTVWATYDNGYASAMVHGYVPDKVVSVGDIINVGQQVYRTGNTGRSDGDHLHYQLKYNGKLIDPAPVILNDRVPTMALKKGDRIEWLQVTYIKPGPETLPTDKRVKTAAKGSVFEIINNEVRTHAGYQWMDTKCNNAQGWARIKHISTGKLYYKKTTRAITNYDGSPVPPPVDPCDAKIKAAVESTAKSYQARLDAKDAEIKKLGAVIIKLDNEKEEVSKQLAIVQTELKLCTERNEKLEQDIKDLLELNKEQADRIIQLEKKNSELSRKITTLQEELAECRKGNGGCLPFSKLFEPRQSELPLEDE